MMPLYVVYPSILFPLNNQ